MYGQSLSLRPMFFVAEHSVGGLLPIVLPDRLQGGIISSPAFFKIFLQGDGVVVLLVFGGVN